MESRDLARYFFLILWIAIFIVSITQFLTTIHFSNLITDDDFFQLPGYFTFSTTNAIFGLLTAIFGMSIRIENNVFMNYVSKKPNMVMVAGILSAIIGLLNITNFLVTIISGMEKFKMQFLNKIGSNMLAVNTYQQKYNCCSWDTVHQFQQITLSRDIPSSCCENDVEVCQIENVKQPCQYVNRDFVLNIAMISISSSALFFGQILVSAWYYHHLK